MSTLRALLEGGFLETWSPARRVLAGVSLAAIPPLIAVLLSIQDGTVPIFTYEYAKYEVSALGLLETGQFVRADGAGGWAPEIERMPGFPVLITAVYAVFGEGERLPLHLIQVLLCAVTVVMGAAAAGAVHRPLTVPTFILLALTPNLFFRAATPHPEVLFTLFITAGLWLALGAPRARRPLVLLLGAGLAWALALETRPAALFVPIFAVPALWLMLWDAGRAGVARAAVLALVPLLLVAAAGSVNAARIHAFTGQVALTTQSGAHAMRWLYPCLRTPTGCGTRNLAALDAAQAEFDAARAGLSPEIRDNPAVLSSLGSEIAWRRIAEIPPVDLATAIIGSLAKVTFHSTWIEILTVHEVRFLPRSEQRARQSAGLSPWTVFWLTATLLVFIWRAVALLGLWVLARDRETRGGALLLVLTAAAIIGVAVSTGNPRYRAPAEPALAILAAAGAMALSRRRRILAPFTVAEGSPAEVGGR